MHIALVNEGTYPVLRGGVSTWCDQLVRALPEHRFSAVTLTGAQRGSVWPAPPNLAGFQPVPMWDPPRRRFSGRPWQRLREQQLVDRAVLHLWRAVLAADGGPSHPIAAERALRILAQPRSQPLLGLLRNGATTRALLAAWDAHRGGTDLPALTGAQAATTSVHVDRMLAVLDTQWPAVDLIHATSNGPAALMALGHHWREGTPMMLTEHGVYLRERYLALHAAGLPWPVRYALMALTRVICRIAYDRCTVLTPVSEFNGRWARRLGADPAKVIPVPNAVDDHAFTPITSEPAVPTVTFVGRIDPLKDLATLIEAFAMVRPVVPDARLRLFGPTPLGNEAYRSNLERLIGQRGLAEAVTFEGATETATPAIEAGHVVALSSISEGLPYTVIESMMCGRATVSTDVGGVNECTGRDGKAGTLVPPRAPQELADALIRLLIDDVGRRRMGQVARERARHRFALGTFAQRYRMIYDESRQPMDPAALGRLRARVQTAASSTDSPDPVLISPDPVLIDLRDHGTGWIARPQRQPVAG